jgi:hypothetical protein
MKFAKPPTSTGNPGERSGGTCCFRFSRRPYRLGSSRWVLALPALNRSSHLARGEEFTVLILVSEWIRPSYFGREFRSPVMTSEVCFGYMPVTLVAFDPPASSRFSRARYVLLR